MRFRKLTVAGVAAISVLVAAPAGASAFKHPSPNGRCRINIEVAPKVITAGDPVVIFGQLLCRRPAEEANQVVRLFHRLPLVPGFSYVQSTTTDSRGFYEFARADGVVNTNRWYLVRSHGAASGRRRLRVAADVTIKGPPEGTQLYTGVANEVEFSGTVAPADVGASVILQRQNALTGNEWHSIGRGVVQSDGTYAIVHAFRFPGDADIRTLVRSQGRNIPSESEPLSYQISQAENPDLTITASADPISFGQSVTISGKLTGGVSVPVTLMARIVGQHFAPVAQVMTDSEGNYTFPAQSPVDSTFYRVQGSGKHSAVLYEGVKDVLTATASPTTVQAGQPVTFSGTVEPDHTGDTIYLERQNASGVGYHVIQLAMIGTGSTYSFAHRFYDAGTKTVRIYVPGGPQNGAAASQPFAITVTPAPAAALTPEARGNTSLPQLGQLDGSENEASGEGLETESES